ncbi:uncharacterized protein LOC120350236 [Nilaparvata lugens]|uniref:uncharacterized protein LOC120350236 n=1 Tax=Nilaparvata lugens TaxID=108931 RepID=UPI00193DE533|nr:uncharacterized protein LOC120350236 [Nilaparvata lugens]
MERLSLAWHRSPLGNAKNRTADDAACWWWPPHPLTISPPTNTIIPHPATILQANRSTTALRWGLTPDPIHTPPTCSSELTGRWLRGGGVDSQDGLTGAGTGSMTRTKRRHSHKRGKSLVHKRKTTPPFIDWGMSHEPLGQRAVATTATATLGWLTETRMDSWLRRCHHGPPTLPWPTPPPPSLASHCAPTEHREPFLLTDALLRPSAVATLHHPHPLQMDSSYQRLSTDNTQLSTSTTSPTTHNAAAAASSFFLFEIILRTFIDE